MSQVAKLNYENFFSQSVDLLCIVGADSLIKHMNNAWSEVLGYSINEFIGHNCFEFLHPEDLEKVKLLSIEAKKKQATSSNYVIRFRHKNGTYRTLEWQTQLAKGIIYCTARDLTNLSTTEKNLLQEQNRLQAIIDAQNKYLIRLDLDFKFTYANKKFINEYAWFYNTTDLNGISIFLDNNETKSNREKCIKSTLSNPATIYEYEEKIRDYNGNVQYLFWQCICLLDEKGNPSEIQCNGLDITESKLQDLEAAQLEEENLLKATIPISILWEGILLLPLVGMINENTAQATMDSILNSISKTQAKVLILDLSGITIMDAQIANYIFKIAKSTRLMGCITTICGISPTVAETMVTLGIDLQEFYSTGTLQKALLKSLYHTGFELTALI